VGVFSEHSVYHQHSFFITCDIYISKHASPRTILQTVMCKCANSFSFWGTWSPDPLDPTGGLPSREPPDRQCLFYRPLWGEFPPLKNFKNPRKKFDGTEEPEARIYGWMTLTKILVPICHYCLNCTEFGQLILRKIIKIFATRCQIIRLKCTKFDFGWGSRPHWGAYSASQTP